MCKGREPKRNIRGRIVSLPKFKNESELTDRSGPERFVNDRHQPAAEINGLQRYHMRAQSARLFEFLYSVTAQSIQREKDVLVGRDAGMIGTMMV